MSPLTAPPSAPDWWYQLRRKLSVQTRVRILAELHARGEDITGWPT